MMLRHYFPDSALLEIHHEGGCRHILCLALFCPFCFRLIILRRFHLFLCLVRFFLVSTFGRILLRPCFPHIYIYLFQRYILCQLTCIDRYGTHSKKHCHDKHHCQQPFLPGLSMISSLLHIRPSLSLCTFQGCSKNICSFCDRHTNICQLIFDKKKADI